VTDRYTKAIEQLGSDKLDVCIGGIYALERISRDSARDHPVVMEVLAAFIREHSREPWPLPGPDGAEPERSTRPDVQSALTVVGRRDKKRDIEPISLGGADLRGANLARANLAGVWLFGADLTHAYLDDANLVGANLAAANLSGAVSIYADLSRASLSGADLRGADLRSANLTRANLSEAKLTGVKLTDANLSGARWPADAAVPEGWKRDADSGRLTAADTSAKTAEEN
jgi:Pentapeptide repeats (8 copies)